MIPLLSRERLAELRHVAEQAASLPNGPWAHRYLSEFIPGVVLELLDMIPEAAEPPEWQRGMFISTMCPGCGQNRTVGPDGFEPHHTAHNGVDGPLCTQKTRSNG